MHTHNATAHYTGKAEHYLDGSVWMVEGTYDTSLVFKNNDWVKTAQRFTLENISGDTTLPEKVTLKMAGEHL